MKKSELWCGLASSCVLFLTLTAATAEPAQIAPTATHDDSANLVSPALASFDDVPPDHWAYDYIEKLRQSGYVSGCSANPPRYCPQRSLTRAEMAVFIVRGVHGAGFEPPEPTEQIFDDVPITAWYAKWVHQLWRDGYTAGCSTDPPLFCPQRAHTRAEATVFFLRMLHGAGFTPPNPSGIFVDVPVSQWYAKWVEAAYSADLIPLCQSGLGRKRFCPESPLNRAMAAFMMVQAKGLFTPQIDLIATALEVTQGVQDLRNSVRLVEGKDTYVRFHVRSESGTHATDARLCVQRSNELVDWLPAIEEPAGVLAHPSRGHRGDSFLFKLDKRYTRGTVTLTGYVNAPTATRGYAPLEKEYGNNGWPAANLTFEHVPLVSFVLCRVEYEHDGTTYYPDVSHAAALIEWLRQAYPLSSATFRLSKLDYGKGLPNCDSVNGKLRTKRNRDISNGTVTSETRYYGIWDDSALGGRTKACAPLGGTVASGPAGMPQGGDDWDHDGTYADWLGGHELGHSFGLLHPPFCGPTSFIDDDFDNPDGNISPSDKGDDAIFGFNYHDNTDYDGIYLPNWKDVMTYCENRWISDQNYQRLMNYFQTSFDPGFWDPGQQNKTNRLLIVGTIDTSSGLVALQPLFIFPNAGEIEPRTPGDHAIVLRAASAAELARYPFTAEVLPDMELLDISEMVPYVDGTVRVDIEGPEGVLITVSAGAAVPTVQITSPAPGANIETDSATVVWTASDVDGDPLVFQVEYHDGKMWETVALNVSDQSARVDVSEAPAGAEARFRVWVSDGIHTAVDTMSFLVTSVEQGNVPIPNGFGLMQNYPNPFNAETRIRYELATGGRVLLMVFNMLGQSVRVLVDENLLPGSHEVTWDGRDASGQPVTSGVYLYRLNSGGMSLTKKMIYLR